MTAITFDTLSTARRLREKGLSQEQAEAIADELRGAVQLDLSHLSTKEEASLFKSELKADMAALRSDAKADMAALRSEMREMELRLTVRLGAMIMALGGVLVAIKYFG